MPDHLLHESIEIGADPEAIFDLTQDYDRRLEWDPFLKSGEIIDGSDGAGVGVRTRCVARSGLAMETEYVSFNRPRTCAIVMTRGPWVIKEFAGSWRFEPIDAEQTRVLFRYSLRTRPSLLKSLANRVFRRDTRRRLRALKRFVEAHQTTFDAV